MEILSDAKKTSLSIVYMYGGFSIAVTLALIIIFSALYVRYFWYKSEKDKFSALVVILGISIALLSATLLPVDVFLVSVLKNSNGTFKNWATNETRQSIENTMSNAYYSLYGIIFFYTFFVLPLAYFSYEERDEDRYVPSFKIFTTALCYTSVFLLLVAALLLAGFFIPFREHPSQNSTEWEKIEFLVKEIYKDSGKDALSFVVNVLTLYGMLNLVFYTGVGLAWCPLSMIKGYRSISEEEALLVTSQASIEGRIEALRNKTSLSSRESTSLSELEEERSLVSRRSQLLERRRSGVLGKLEPCSRILGVSLGVIGVVFSLLLFISLLIANIDKLINSLGYNMGYVLKESKLPNPLDFVMVQCQKVYPLDYVFFFCIILFLVVCTVSGMRFLGIRCFCVQMYKIRPGRTPPQGLIMLSFILMFSVLAINILMYSVVPSYTTFGSQYYVPPNSSERKSCSLDAPSDDCVMTRASVFIIAFAYKAWIFAATYFWLSWLFLAAFLLSFVYILIRTRRSSLEEAISKDDFDESDEQPIRI